MSRGSVHCLCMILFVCSLLTANLSGQDIPYTPGLDDASLDRTADPCVDFYQFACGGWMKNNPIPGDQTSWSVGTKLQDENRTLLRQILENAAKPDPKRSATDQRIGDYYAACMDEKLVEDAGAKPLQPDLERIAKMKSVRDI